MCAARINRSHESDVLMEKKNITSPLILLVAAIIWGFAFSAQVVAAENGLGGFTFNCIRFIIGGISLIPVALIFEREKLDRTFVKNTALPATLAGVVLFFAASLQQTGINLTQSAGKASFITGLYIVLVPIASRIFFKHKTSVGIWLGVAFALAGLYFLSITPGEKILLGDVLVFVGTFFWTAHILTVDRFSEKMSPIKFSMIQFFVCGILALIAALCFEDISVEGIVASKWAILFAGVFSSGVAYTCQVVGQKNCDPTVATIILSLESVFGAIGGLLINGERLTNRSIIGCVLMFIGIILAQIELPQKKKT